MQEDKKDDSIDWKRMAQTYQIELELERANKKRPFELKPISIDLIAVMEWVEKHYLFVITAVIVLNYAITTVLDVVDRSVYGAKKAR